jgi:hypothetical protein
VPLGEAGEHGGETGEHPANAGVREARAVVGRAEEQLVPAVGREGEGGAGALVDAQRAGGPWAALGAKAGVEQIILVDEQALEEGSLRGDLARCAHGDERSVLVIAKGRGAGAERAEPVERGGVQGDGDAQREGVDEHPHHGVGALAVERGAAAGPSDAKDHIALAAEAREEERPGTLNEGIEGEALSEGERPQRGDLRRGDLDFSFTPGFAFVERAHGAIEGERRGGGDAREGFHPEIMGTLGILAGNPGEVIREGAPGGERGDEAASIGLVRGEEIVNDEGERAAVEEQMGEGPDEAVLALGEAEERDALERRCREIKASPAIVAEMGVDRGLGQDSIASLEVVDDQRWGGVGDDDLTRLVEALPSKGRSQHRVVLTHATERGLESRRVDRLAQGEDELLEIDPGAGREQGLEQHALLHRRERQGGAELVGAHRSRSTRPSRARVDRSCARPLALAVSRARSIRSAYVVDGAHRLGDIVGRAVANHLVGAAVVDHAHVADVVELGRGEGRGAVAPQALGWLVDEMRDGEVRRPVSARGARAAARAGRRG